MHIIALVMIKSYSCFNFRHHDIRNINVGLCMDDFGDCRDNGEADCKGQGKGSCECRHTSTFCRLFLLLLHMHIEAVNVAFYKCCI